MERFAGNTLPSDAPPPKRATFGGRMSRKRCYQEGSLVQTWYTQESVGRALVGRRDRFEIRIERIRRSAVLGTVAEIPTAREARQMMSDLLRKVNSGEYRPQAVWTFGRFVEDRWKPDVYPTLKFSSKKFYDNMVDTHLNPVFGDTQLRLISKDSVNGFLTAKAKGDSSWKTVKHIRTVFGSILEAAVRDELLVSNPVRRTRLPRRAPVEEKAPISPESLRALLERLPEPLPLHCDAACNDGAAGRGIARPSLAGH